MKWGIFCLFERYETDACEAIHAQMRLVEQAEKEGLEEVWFGEHHFNDFSICPSPTVLLANACARTQTIRLGCAGFLAPFYDAIRLAEDAAMLDILSRGRFNLGLAKGAFAPDSKHFNTTTEQLRPKLLECAKAVDSVLNTRDHPVSFHGDFFDFTEVDVEPKTLQSSIPTYIATFASEETIAFAARKGWGLMLSQGVDLDECERVSRYYASIAGCEPEIVLLRTFYVAQNYEEAFAKARPAIDHFVKSMRAASSFNKSPQFDQTRYQALIQERNVFFDGQKFFENGIIGDAQRCIDACLMIQKRFPKVHVALKLLGTNENENARLLHDFTQLVRPFVDKAHHG